VSESFEELLGRMEAWLAGAGQSLLDSLRRVARDWCGLSDEDAALAARVTIMSFVREAGRTPDLDTDFRMLMDFFKKELKPRVEKHDIFNGFRTLVSDIDRESLLEALEKFPGGLRANLPDVGTRDWQNAVLASLTRRPDPERTSPWVHPDLTEPPPPVHVLLERLFDADPAVRREAAKQLARHGPAAEPALDALTQALSDPDRGVRVAVRRAIRALKV
jgi:hypothetical protein